MKMRCVKHEIFLMGILMLAGLCCRSFGEVRVLAQIDTQKDIYAGENFTYYIIIDGENKPGEADLSPLAKYNPRSAGNQDVSQSSISIINGKTTQNIVKRYVMSYQLNAPDVGAIQLAPVKVVVDGKEYQTNTLEVNILKPGTTELLDLEVKFSEQQCFVGQPVIMNVNFYISANIGDFQFNIPALSNDNFVIEEPDAHDPQAKEYQVMPGVTTFVSQNKVVHKGKDSLLLSFGKVLIPKQAGEMTIPQSSVSANVEVGRNRSSDSFDDFFGARRQYKRFQVVCPSSTLTVKPLPENGKPSDFSGLVGKYSISAAANPTTVSVGEPITLTIKISGKFLKPVQWPNLEKIPELTTNFRLPSEKSSPTIEDDYKVFTQTIRAESDKVAAIPSIPLSYFDAEKGEYAVAKTEPIKLQVSPTKILTSKDIEGKEPRQVVNQEVESIKKGLSANYERLDALENQSFSPLSAVVSPTYGLIWIIPFLTLLTSSAIKLFTYTTPTKIAARRRQQAKNTAVRNLKKLLSQSKEQQHELLINAMKQYVGERFDKIAGSLTADDCCQIIIEKTADQQAAEKFKQTLTQYEAVRYAAAESEINSELIKEIINLVGLIDKKAGK